MAAVKFFMEFENVQGDLCTVNFIFEDYNDAPIRLYGGPQPFVLGEFNQDFDLFKPIRPQQATIQVLASAGGVSLEDFLTDNDTDITVRFDFGDFGSYWSGILSQEDIEETWISTNHILTLRSDEGFGRLQTKQLNDGTGAALIGTYTPFNYIQYAADDVIGSFFYTRIYSNLFHTSMSSASNQTGIDQCLIDARTFEQSPGVFDNGYTVLEKINRAWSQTLFQWNSLWVILRIPELFRTGNLVGFNTNRPTVGNRASVNKRYDIEVGVQEDVKPIVPEMLKTVIKPKKETTIQFDWEQYDQVICNESFRYGDFIETTGTPPNETDKYSIDSWTVQQGPIGTPVSSTKIFQRHVVYAENRLDDEYAILQKDASVNTWARSCNVYVSKDSDMTFSVQYSLKNAMGFTKLDAIGLIQLYASDGTYYTMDDDGIFYQSNASWTTNVKLLQVTYASGEGEDWGDYEVSGNIPKDGYLNFLLLKDTTNSFEYVYFRGLSLEIEPKVQKFRRLKIKGDYDRYTIDREVVNNETETIFLDDAQLQIHRGAILETDGITLTNDEWYRRTDFNGDVTTDERLTFKRQHALSKWYMNRGYKTKLDVNLFGLKWKDQSDVTFPIGIINTIKFVDDAPTKIFAITNLKEIDFMSCTWSATLIEIVDTTIADNEPGATDVHTFDYYYE
jgi:hypothetical protein